MMLRIRRTASIGLAFASAVVVACGGGAAHRGDSGPHSGSARAIVTPGNVAASSHVVMIVMENKEAGQVLGAVEAPFLTHLAARYGAARRSYGVRHPSLPNYIALISGSTQRITDDCTSCHANGPNLADQLERAHASWGAYLEGLPGSCARPAAAGRYVKKHDPFAYDDAIASDRARCRRRVPLTRLAADVRAGRLPDFAFIAPDLCSDTHDCPVATGDRFLSRLVPGLLPALGPHGFLVVTYDEGATDRGCCGGSDGGRVATVVAGPDVRAGARSTQPVDDFGVLGSIEDAFALPRLSEARDRRHGSLKALFVRPPQLGR